MTKLTLTLVAVIFGVGAQIASPQDKQPGDLCHDVLRLAFYDRFFDLQTTKSRLAWTAWACSAGQSEIKRQSSLGLDIPIPDADLIVGAQANDASESKWREKHCSSQTLDTDDERLIWQQRETVSRYMGDAIKAWESCMKGSSEFKETDLSQQVNVHLDPISDYKESGMFTLTVRGKRIGKTDPPAVRIAVKGAECDGLQEWFSPDEVLIGQSVSCTRKAVPDASCSEVEGVNTKGFSVLNVQAEYAYDAQEKNRPHKMVVALIPGVKSMCKCDQNSEWSPDFLTDSSNCGSCGLTCGGIKGRCRAGLCAICQITSPSKIETNGRFDFSCKIGANKSAMLRISGAIDMEPPAQNGNIDDKFANATIEIGQKSDSLSGFVKGPGAQDHQPIWQFSEPVEGDASGMVRGTIRMTKCYWGNVPVACDLSKLEITVNK